MHDRNDDDDIGRRVTEARLLAGLTQQALADRLQWPVSTLGNYESGRRALRVTHLLMIAQALGRPAAAFLATEPAEATLIERLAGQRDRWKQVALFLDSLDADAR
jgi:transcriptional regulator with XRE-family HTH domain